MMLPNLVQNWSELLTLTDDIIWPFEFEKNANKININIF